MLLGYNRKSDGVSALFARLKFLVQCMNHRTVLRQSVEVFDISLCFSPSQSSLLSS